MSYNPKWYIANKEVVSKRNVSWRKRNPDKLKVYNFRAKLKTNYNLSEEDYLNLLNGQNNLCAICNKEDKLNIDHCHSTNKIRGLLCSRCNLGLGHFQDNVGLLSKAIKYLDDKKDKAPSQ